MISSKRVPLEEPHLAWAMGQRSRLWLRCLLSQGARALYPLLLGTYSCCVTWGMSLLGASVSSWIKSEGFLRKVPFTYYV